LARHRLDEAGFGDVVDTAFALAAAEVVASERPGPGDAAGMRKQAELQRGQVAHADPARAGRDALGDALPVDAVEQARQAIAAPRCKGDARTRRGDAMHGGGGSLVVAGEALRLERRRLVRLDGEAEPAETRCRTA